MKSPEAKTILNLDWLFFSHPNFTFYILSVEEDIVKSFFENFCLILELQDFLFHYCITEGEICQVLLKIGIPLNSEIVKFTLIGELRCFRQRRPPLRPIRANQRIKACPACLTGRQARPGVGQRENRARGVRPGISVVRLSADHTQG